MEDVYWERLEKKMELNSKQVALITHRIDGLLEGNFPPMKSIIGLQPRISCFVKCISLDLQLRILLSAVVTLFARSILEPLKRLCCLVSPFKSPNPA